MGFDGKHIVLTGGLSGIGLAIANQLTARGASVYTASRSDFMDLPYRFQADLSDKTSTLTWIDYLRTIGVTFDGLIHCAGAYCGSFFDLASASLGDIDYMMRVNFYAPVMLTQGLLSYLASDGQVVFINSSVKPSKGMVGYAASKQALRVFADALRCEVNERGMRVISVYPSRTNTAMGCAGFTGDPANLLPPSDVATAVLDAMNMPRTAEVTDIHIRSMKKY